ncbi:MAG TPA: hypothetical protein VHB47_23605 [Thermoanaerobaculia bacterium]|jgi:hypothetical protein|nr:hypothetical protein [Thermoanaerobaculia bacterium]
MHNPSTNQRASRAASAVARPERLCNIPPRPALRMATLAVAMLAMLAILASSATSARAAGASPSRFNRPGNILIADQFNNRVIEIDPQGNIVFQFGQGPNDLSAASIVGCNDAQRVGRFTLMAGTGIPPNTVPNCTDPNGCADNRVILVDRLGRIRWQYGQFGVTGSGPNELSTPVQSTWLPNGDVLITDQANERVIEVNAAKRIVWQYGTTGTSGNGPNQLSNPNSAELLDNGHILIADENNNRAIEVKRNHSIVHTFTAGGTVSGVAFASRLPNGHTLLTDSNNSRAVEVDPADHVVWQYVTNTETGSNPNPLPTRAIRLANGNTIISDQFNHRVIVVDHAGNLVTSYGTLNVPGYGTQNASQGLFGPYDAKVIGDYTGLTPPFDDDEDGDDGGN